MPNNIIITPGSASIQFSGSANNDTIRLQVEASGSVAFYGNSGSLFSIVDQLSGSLMSVNDISGLPILEVFSDNRVVAGTFNQNTLVVTGSRVGIRKAFPNAELDISGSVFVSGGIEITSGSEGLTLRIVPGSDARIGGTTGNTVVQSGNVARAIFSGNGILPFLNNFYDLGTNSLRWNNAFINNVLSSGSSTHTGSLSILSGSINVTNGGITGSLFGTSSVALIAQTASYFDGFITFPSGLDITGSLIVTGSQTTIGNQIISGAITSSGPQHGILLQSGSNTLSITYPAGGSAGANWLYRAVNSAHVFRINSTDAIIVDSSGMGPVSNNIYTLGGASNRFESAYINNILSSGSSTHTGSLTFNSGGVTSSLFGTSSWASNAISSSFASTASFAISASWAPSAPGGGITQLIAGDGLTGGTITSTGTITLDTGSVHFLDGVKKELNTEGVISGSTFSSPSQGTVRAIINGVQTDVDTGLQTGDSPQFTNLNVSSRITASIVSASTSVTASRVQLNGLTDTTATNKVLVLNTATNQIFTTASILPSGLISSSQQFNSLTAPFTGSFTGSFTGAITHFSPSTVKLTVGTTAPASPAVNDLWVDTN